MREVGCAYCGEDFCIDIDRYAGSFSDGDSFEESCPHCEKRLMINVQTSIEFSSEKADCLNGAQCVYSGIKSTSENLKYVKCEICSEETYEDELAWDIVVAELEKQKGAKNERN